MFYPLLRHLFFALDPETAHGLGMTRRRSPQDDRRQSCLLAKSSAAGPGAGDGARLFPTRSVWRPGWTRTATTSTRWPRWASAFIEIGTVTPACAARKSQAAPVSHSRRGRRSSIAWASTMTAWRSCWPMSRPRASRATVESSESISARTSTTPIDRAADDYLLCLDRVYAAASYVTVNISSPNTRNLRELQEDDALDALLGQPEGRAVPAGRSPRQVRTAGAENRPGPRRPADPGDCRPAARAPHGRRHRHQHHRLAQRCRGLAECRAGGWPVGRAGAGEVDRGARQARRQRWPANCRSLASAAS
jgi:hypothetical protein